MHREPDMKKFQRDFRGAIIAPGESNYDAARALYNAMIDKRPRLIARCRDVADVMTAVNFAREHALRIAVRGGGHSGAGLASCDDGLMIDLSQINGVRVEPSRGVVRVEAGCTQGDMDHATHPFGLAVPSGIVSTTGVSGLTLGGGHGYLSRRYGLTIDNLIEADVVLADGSLVTASERENADLFWGLRGGGGNFGIATSFLFRAHPVKNVYGGPIFWDIAHATEVMRAYREFLPAAPESLCPFLGLKTVPSSAPFPSDLWGRRICALICCYDGSAEDGERALAPLRAAVPAPILNGLAEMPYPAMQSLFDPLLPKGMQWYWKGDFVRELSDAAIEAHLDHAARAPTELSLMHLYPIDGAVHAVGSGDTAWRCRDARWSMVICGIDPRPEKAMALRKWGREYWQAVHPFNAAGGYVNFMMDDEAGDRIEATYGQNFPALVDLKRKRDPTNLFRNNHNIAPDASYRSDAA
jgi:FAD/FMN-containing dehydrogenase